MILILLQYLLMDHVKAMAIKKQEQELESIFGRRVDLVENGTLRNPFRRQAILSSKEVLYAAS